MSCPSCRRPVPAKFTGIGAECSRCGAFLPSVKVPTSNRSASSSAPVNEAAIAIEIADAMLAEAALTATSIAAYGELVDAAQRVAAEYAERRRVLEERRGRAQHWREMMPGVAEAFVR